ncbi:hypothetical protein NQ317_018964 [Molorchus minor]|uniref:GATA zinc finger domain-containing protein 14-like n=1 Tax=Molorchus minor TaxID=1323400 RepID=A0ABQ9JKF3_9CUCU|nr:hypothetical protein NQ317_018964 [Molorchus minor]
MPNSDDIQASRSDTGHVEPYKLSEIFSVIPEYDGNQIFLQTFLNAVRCANSMAIGNQRILLTLHVKNKLRAIRPNPNFQNQQRPPVIRSNPNFNQPRAHHVNAYNNEYFDDTVHQYSSDQYYYDQNNYDEYYDYSNNPNQYDYTDFDNTAYQQYEQLNYDDTAHQFETFNENNYPNSDFPDTSNQNHPPNQQTTEILTLQNQVQTLSLNEEQKSKEQCFL